MLRRARIEDAPAIFRVHMESIRGLAYTSYRPEQIDAWCGRRGPTNYEGPIRAKVMYVAEIGTQIVGFSQLDQRTGVVEAVYVHPTQAKTGLGRALLQAIEVAAQQKGLVTLSLEASLNAVPFYSKAGYIPGKTTDHDVGAGISIPCVHMTRILNSSGA